MPTDTTVEHIFCAWMKEYMLPQAALKGVVSILQMEKAEDLFLKRVVHHEELWTDRGLEMASLAGEKFIKALASEFAYFSFPGGDTSRLTNATRVLMDESTFGRTLKRFFGLSMSSRKVFTGFLALVVYTSGPLIARDLLLPVLSATLRECQYALDLPRYICIFRPGLRFSECPHEEQVNILLEELLKRNITVTKEEEEEEKENGGGTLTTASALVEGTPEVRYTVRVLYGLQEVSCETNCSYVNYAMTILEQVAQCVSKGKESMPEMRPAVEFMKMWMHETHRVLRLQAPYNVILPSTFQTCMCEANGWMPLSEIVHFLSTQCKRSNTLAPNVEELKQLLQQHDHFQRFQVGVCEIKESPFEGQECARAIYAHQVRNSLAERIFGSFPRENDPSECPIFAWVHVNPKTLRNLCAGPLVLFDNINFIRAFQWESLEEFHRYRQEVPLHEQFDEKLSSKNVIFAQFCLRAAVRDTLMTVVQVPPRDASSRLVSWAVFSKRFENSERNDKSCAEVPRYYFTGQVVSLGAALCDVNIMDECDANTTEVAMVKKLVVPLVEAEPVGFTKDEVDFIFSDNRKPNDLDLHITDEAIESTNVMDLGPKSLATAEYLNTGPARQQVLTLVDDPDLCMTRVCFPLLDKNNLALLNRKKDLNAFKLWVRQLGLSIRLFDSNGENSKQQEEYEVRKRGVWDMQFIQHIAQDLQLEQLVDLRKLRQAVTRECEDETVQKSGNYEIFEFTGDAIMDFIVVFDSFLLGEPWNHNIFAHVCCNKVLAHLIPDALSDRLSRCYDNINTKVKADMMESIVGATYRSLVGLDEVRSLLFRFFLRIPRVMEKCFNDLEAIQVLQSAADACPYLRPGADKLHLWYKYECVSLLDQETVAPYLITQTRPFDCGERSHYASTPFARIQDKKYATHFTTGTGYSYRRIAPMDIPQMLNRILSAFAGGGIAFVNENLTEDTHLTIDFDGANVRHCGVLYFIYQWFRTLFKTKSTVLLLDCSGISVVTKKLKQSYHIHFPQAVTTLDNLRELTENLRQYIVKCLARHTLLGTVVGYMSAEENKGEGISLIGKVFLSTKYLSIQKDGMKPECDPCDLALPSMDLVTLLTFGSVSRTKRYIVLKYLCGLSQEPKSLAKVAGLSEKCIFPNYTNKDAHYALLRVRWASSSAQDLVDKIVLVDESMLSVITETQPTDCVCRVVRKIPGKEASEKEFIEKGITPLRQESIFCAGYWEHVIDSGLVESKKLRMYLNDKYDMVYKQEYRPLFMDAIYQENRVIPTTRPKRSTTPFTSASKSKDDDKSEYPLEMAHLSVLRLTSLRSPDYRDVHGLLRSPWGGGCNADETFGMFDDIPVTCDNLPTFDEYMESPEGLCDSWRSWVIAVSVLEPKTSLRQENKESDTAKVAALQPAYWTFNDVAVLWIAGEAALRVGHSNTSPLEALTTYHGMSTIAKILIPSVKIEDKDINPAWITVYSPHVFPLFYEFRKKLVNVLPLNDTTVDTPNCAEKKGDGRSSQALSVSSSAPTTKTKQSLKREVHLLQCSATEGMDGICRAVSNALCGEIRQQQLFVTSNKEMFISLSSCFKNVVSPEYFLSSNTPRFREFYKNIEVKFSHIFIFDEEVTPYENSELIRAIWRSLSYENGVLHAFSVAVQQRLLQII